MNEKLSLPSAVATPIEQLQQQQQHHNSSICATIDHADYRYESTLPVATVPATTTTTPTAYTHESNSTSNNAKTSGIDEADGGGAVVGSELYRYASVASLSGGPSSTMLSGMDAFMANAGGVAHPAAGGPLVAPAATILKISNNSTASGNVSKGSNLSSPHRQQQLGCGSGGGAPQRDNFCGCFGGRGGGGVADVDGKSMAHEADGDKQQLAALTFWPALFANLGICTLLLGYLFIGSFLFLTIETSGDGGSAAGVVSDPNGWTHAQNAYISTKQQKLTHQHTSFAEAQSKLYKSSEPLLDVATTGAMVHLQGAAATAATEGGKPHEHKGSIDSNGNYHVNTPNVKRQVAVNSTGPTTGAVAVAMSVAQGDVIAQPENPETYIDNRHANRLRETSGMTAQQQQPNDVATYAALQRQAKTAKSQAFRRAAVNAIDAAIGSDINGAVDDVEVSEVVGVAMADGEGSDCDMADAAAGAGGAWGGENVALQRTVENIWDITVSLNILYKENWTKLAALEINKFQDQLVKRLVMDLTLSTASTPASNDAYSRHQQLFGKQDNNFGQQQPSQPYNYHSMEPAATSKHYGNDATQQQQQQQLERYWQLQAARQRQWLLQQQKQQFEWNFATSFLYSLTVVTTVGYGTITPRTTLGRMVTIVYATVGIPLTLVYLSSIGSILAKLASGFCERLLCCCFCRASTNKRHTICGFNRQQVSDKKCNLKLQQLQKHHQQQQQHSTSTVTSAPQQTAPATQSAHLPYCYVRPPAEDALNYAAEHSPLSSAHSGRTRSGSAHTLRWSLAVPLGFCVLLLLAYVAFGSLVIALLEQWSLFDGIYFCFMSLTTIGFCDLLPGAHVRPATTASTLVVWFCAAYILSGLTLTSMCVNLLHDEFLQHMRVVVKFKKIATGKNTSKERNIYGAPPP